MSTVEGRLKRRTSQARDPLIIIEVLEKHCAAWCFDDTLDPMHGQMHEPVFSKVRDHLAPMQPRHVTTLLVSVSQYSPNFTLCPHAVVTDAQMTVEDWTCVMPSSWMYRHCVWMPGAFVWVTGTS